MFYNCDNLRKSLHIPVAPHLQFVAILEIIQRIHLIDN